MFCEAYWVSEPALLPTVSSTGNTPGMSYLTEGCCWVEKPGVPPGKFHTHESGLPVDASIKGITLPGHTWVTGIWILTAGATGCEPPQLEKQAPPEASELTSVLITLTE